jgi:glycosyltransferase involved in cell wall biosynthesis
MKTVFFVQQSPALAGSQKSLLRLMQALDKCWQPVLITGSDGWLTSEVRAAGIPVIVYPFPSSRSFKARVFGNWGFGRAVANLCKPYIDGGCLVHGNDHIQSLLALALAGALRVPSVLTVRSGAMSRRDFFKYGCDRHGRVVAVGEQLHQRIREWGQPLNITLIENGVNDTEITQSAENTRRFPSTVLVPGSIPEFKGWRDLVDALVLLEERGLGAAVEFQLLGNNNGLDVAESVGASRLKTFRIRHIPLTHDFKKTAGSFPFAVHPSRSESFGMALLEVLAAGVPVLTSRTGVAERVVADSRFLFEPSNPVDLAEKLAALMSDFSGADQVVRRAQEIIRKQYCVSRTAAQYMELYQSVMSLADFPPVSSK